MSSSLHNDDDVIMHSSTYSVAALEWMSTIPSHYSTTYILKVLWLASTSETCGQKDKICTNTLSIIMTSLLLQRNRWCHHAPLGHPKHHDIDVSFLWRQCPSSVMLRGNHPHCSIMLRGNHPHCSVMLRGNHPHCSSCYMATTHTAPSCYVATTHTAPSCYVATTHTAPHATWQPPTLLHHAMWQPPALLHHATWQPPTPLRHATWQPPTLLRHATWQPPTLLPQFCYLCLRYVYIKWFPIRILLHHPASLIRLNFWDGRTHPLTEFIFNHDIIHLAISLIIFRCKEIREVYIHVYPLASTLTSTSSTWCWRNTIVLAVRYSSCYHRLHILWHHTYAESWILQESDMIPNKNLTETFQYLTE